MRVKLGQIFLFTIWGFCSKGFCTYSIVAVDTLTREVGGAGATCIKNASTSVSIISDIHPNVGVIHSQASYVEGNQRYARELMDAGNTPDAIIDSLTENDVQRNPDSRQYGIADLLEGGRSAGFTGNNNMDYKGHILGRTYSIQGNILLGASVLERMEEEFLAARGSLADKLVAALGGGAISGADTRCDDWRTSAVSAFVRVARPGDSPNNLYLNIDVNNFQSRTEPVTTLTEQYIEWKNKNVSVNRGAGKPFGLPHLNFSRSAFSVHLTFELTGETDVHISVFNLRGKKRAVIFKGRKKQGRQTISWDIGNKEDRREMSHVYLLKIGIGRFVAVYKMVNIGQ